MSSNVVVWETKFFNLNINQLTESMILVFVDISLARVSFCFCGYSYWVKQVVKSVSSSFGESLTVGVMFCCAMDEKRNQLDK